MKKASVIFLFIFFLLNCQGQSLLQEGKLWSNTGIGTMPGSIYSSYFIKFMGDTTINGMVYKKIMKSNDALHSKWTLNGYIREELATGKVFTFNESAGKDILLYDFSLEMGDSILTGDGHSYAKVTKVVNSSFGSSTIIRKQIYFFDPNGTTKWIEGIGSTWGIMEGLNSFYTTGADHKLVCYSENDQQIYHNPKFMNCFPEGNYSDSDASFINPSKVWIVATEVFGGAHNLPPTSNYYKFIGDTVFSDLVYAKMYTSTKIDRSDWKLNSFWREDKSGKIFIRYDQQEENLIYNFNLAVGDTIKNKYKGEESVVDSISIKPFGIENRKYLYSHQVFHNYHVITWVEGVGSLIAPTIYGGIYVTGGTYILSCFEENGQLIYHNPAYANCFYTSSLTIKNPVEEIEVYPNPVSDKLFVAGNFKAKDYRLELYSVKGELVKTECLDSGINQYRIDVSSLKNGVYILRLITSSGKYEEKVIIKK